MKKIMFNDRYGLTAAVLQGRKTMTRRVCKEYATGQLILANDVESFRFYPNENIVEFLMKDGTIKVSVPPYKDNEVVAVAQSYEVIHDEMTNGDYGDSKYDAFRCAMVAGTKGWDNKLFVRPDLMPHQIQITGVSIERLQAISDEDCLKEGVICETFDDGTPLCYKVLGIYDKPKSLLLKEFMTPREAFAAIINRPGVGHKGLWEENPFVVVYGFKLIK